MWQRILDLPIIVQGALGSALCWVTIELLRLTFRATNRLFAHFSRHIRRENEERFSIYLGLLAGANSQERAEAFRFCMVRAVRRLGQGLVGAAVSALAFSFFPPLAWIAIPVSIYFFCRGVWWITIPGL